MEALRLACTGNDECDSSRWEARNDRSEEGGKDGMKHGIKKLEREERRNEERHGGKRERKKKIMNGGHKELGGRNEGGEGGEGGE